MIQVALICAEGLIRAGFRQLLARQAGIEITAEGEDLSVVAAKHPPDCAVVDLELAGIGGLETVRRICRQHESLGVVAVTANPGSPFAGILLRLGVRGLVSRCSPEACLIDAVRHAAGGRRYVAPKVAQCIAVDGATSGEPGRRNLTAREMQVLGLVTAGHTTREICEVLSLSPKTVSTYRRSLHDKFSVATDVMLVHTARANGIL